MIEDRYHKDQPAVKEMAQRIAANGPKVFPTTDEFIASYGVETADMVASGGLLAALWDIGVDAVPGTLEGEGHDRPKGLKVSVAGKVS